MAALLSWQAWYPQHPTLWWVNFAMRKLKKMLRKAASMDLLMRDLEVFGYLYCIEWYGVRSQFSLGARVVAGHSHVCHIFVSLHNVRLFCVVISCQSFCVSGIKLTSSIHCVYCPGLCCFAPFNLPVPELLRPLSLLPVDDSLYLLRHAR